MAGDRDQIGCVDGKRQQAQIGGAGADRRDAPIGRARPDLDFRLRMQALELAQQAGEDVEADGHPAHQPHRSTKGLARVADERDRVLEILEDAVTELQQRFTRRRDADASPDAQEHGLVQLVLEQQDLPADRRLGHVQPLTGRSERAGFRYRANDLELPQVHLGPPRGDPDYTCLFSIGSMGFV